MKSKKVTRQGINEGAAVMLLATVLVKLIGALFKIPLSSNLVLGDVGFGYFSSAYDLFAPVYTLAISGFPVAVSRIVADFAAQNRWYDVKTVLKVSKRLFLSLGAVAGLLMLALSFPFVSLTDKSGQSIYSMLAVVPSFILCFIASVYRGYFEGLHNMSITAVSNVIEALGKLVLGLGLAVVTVKCTGNVAYAAAAAMVGITLGTLASLVYLFVSFKASGGISDYQKPQKNSHTYSTRKIIKIIICISVPVALSSMSSSIVSLIDALTVRWQLSGLDLTDIYSVTISEYSNNTSNTVTADVLPTFLYGIRSKAFTIYNLVPTLTVAVGISAIPDLTESYAKKNITAVAENTASVLKLSALITLPAAAGFISLGGGIMSLLYGEGASAEIGGRMLFLYGIAVVFSGVAIPLGCVLQAINRQKQAFYNVLAGVLIKLALNLILCANPQFNIFGAVISTLFCNLIMLVLHLISLLKCVGRALDFKLFLKPFAAAILCSVAAWGISLCGNSRLIIALSIIVAAVVYVFSLVQFGAFSEQEILKLPAGKIVSKVFNRLKLTKR